MGVLRLDECALAPIKGCRRAVVRGDGTSILVAAVGFGDHASRFLFRLVQAYLVRLMYVNRATY
jgi:hypothetical protein